jgi:hypothetical protein
MGATGKDSRISDAQLKELAALDFTPTILQLDFVSRRASKELMPQVGYIAAGAKVNSIGDEFILGARRMPEGYLWTNSENVGAVSFFLAKEKRLPANGMDLFPELQSWEGYSKFQAMSADERLHKYFRGINPYTGHFYQGYAGERFEAGGIKIELLTRKDGHWVDPDGTPFQSTDPNQYPDKPIESTETFKYSILGDSPGEVLYYDHMSLWGR